MAAEARVETPYSYFPNPNSSKPIFDGFIYVGLVDTDPQQPANQIDVVVQQEDGTRITIPAGQQNTTPGTELRTSKGGVPTYSGSPVEFLVDDNYSITVLDKLKSQVLYSNPNVLRFNLAGLGAPGGAEQVGNGGIDSLTATELMNSQRLASAQNGRVVTVTANRQGVAVTYRMARRNAAPGANEYGFQSAASPGVYWILQETDGNVLYYDAPVDNFVSDASAALLAAASHVGKIRIPRGVGIRTTDLPNVATLSSIVGEDRETSILRIDLNTVTRTYNEGFTLANLTWQSVQRIGAIIQSPRLCVSKCRFEHVGTTTVLSRYNPIEFANSPGASVDQTTWKKCGPRFIDCENYNFTNFWIDVERVGEGPNGNTDGTDGIKSSRSQGNISNGHVLNSSRDVIDVYQGGGRTNIDNVVGVRPYFHGIEIKILASDYPNPAENILPAEINISNFTVHDGGAGGNGTYGGIYIRGESTAPNRGQSIHDINISNYNCYDFGNDAATNGAYHGIFATDVANLNVTNANIHDISDAGGTGGFGLTAIRCKNVNVGNSSIHGEARGLSVNNNESLNIGHTTIGFSEKTQSNSAVAAIVSGTSNDNLSFDHVDFISAADTTFDATGAGGDDINFTKCNFDGRVRIDTVNNLEGIGCNIAGKNNALDGFFKGSTTGESIRWSGGLITNVRHGINNQNSDKTIVIGVEFKDNNTGAGGVPVSGASATNRVIIGCISDSAGAFPTPSGNDQIANNIAF